MTMANWWQRGTTMSEKITLDSLAAMVRNSSEQLERLAMMVKQGFDQVDQRFAAVDRRFEGIEGRLDRLEQGQDEVRMRLDQAAYRFELVELTHRVKTIENKVGLTSV